MDVKQTVNEIILEVLGSKIKAKDLSPEKLLIEDLGAESIQLLEISLTVAAEFDIDVPKDEIMNLTTLNDVYKFVMTKKEKK